MKECSSFIRYEQYVKLLAFDTSTTACTVAISHGDALAQTFQVAPMQHAKLLLPMIQDLLQELSLSLHELDAIIYGAGPGSYTGIRIASSVAQALSFAISKPVIQISSLAVYAQTAWLQHQWETVLVAQDARMQQIYFAGFKLHGGLMQNMHPDSVLSYEQLAQYLITPSPIPLAYVGDGWQLLPAKLTPKMLDYALLPRAEALLQLGKANYVKGNCLKPEEAQPIYLRTMTIK